MYTKRRMLDQDTLYEIIKHEILTHKVESGQRLMIQPLATKHRVSSTPVREVLIRLAAEDYISLLPGVGFFAKRPESREYQELFNYTLIIVGWSIDQLREKYHFSANNGCTNSADAKRLIQEFPRLRCSQENDCERTLEERITNICVSLVKRNNNDLLVNRIHYVNDRVRTVRQTDFTCCADARMEVSQITEYFIKQDYDALLGALSCHFEGVVRRLPEILSNIDAARHCSLEVSSATN